MFRDLKAIEIAEGALLADIAVVFQFIARFLPVGSSFFVMLCFIVYTVLVLRRGLYVGVMGMCVAIFLMSVIMGPQSIFIVMVEGLGGIFLGFTMKHRFHHVPLVVLGALCGALFLYCVFFGISVLTGFSANDFVHSLRQSYNLTIPVAASTATRLGMAQQWKQSIYPQISQMASWAFAYWWITLYALFLIFLFPAVSAIYVFTNFFVRLLGYDVRPFPGGRLGKSLHRFTRRIFKLAVKWGIVRKLWLKM